MTRLQVVFARVVIGALALLAFLTQAWAVPHVGAAAAARYPEVAYLERPYVAAVVIAILGFELALLAAWKLLPSESAGDVRTSTAKGWATALAGSLWFMAAVIAGVCVHAGFVELVGGSLTVLGILVCLAVVPVGVVLRREAAGLSLRDDVDHMPVGHAR